MFSILYIFFWLTTCTAIFKRRCNAWCYEMETRVQRIQKNINSYKPGVPKLKIKKPNTIELFRCELRFPSKLLTNRTTLLRRKKHFFKKTPTPCSKILLLRTLSSRVLRLAPKVFKERYERTTCSVNKKEKTNPTTSDFLPPQPAQRLQRTIPNTLIENLQRARTN